MHTISVATFVEVSRTVVSMCSAGIVLCLVALWSAKAEIARAPGMDKIVALSNLCFATPLAIFGALHLSDADLVLPLVPGYMPGRLFWAYFVGVALMAAALSIATKIQVSCSGLLFGSMMFLFVAMLYLPSAFTHPGSRLAWTFVLRESSFGCGAWVLAGAAMRQQGCEQSGSRLIRVGRVGIGLAALFFGVAHFLQPGGCPGVPLQKMTPEWIPGRLLIGYLTGTILFLGGICILLGKKTRIAATYLGTWILLLVVFIYKPILIAQMSSPNTKVRIEGINYFADTMLFAGVILALASATPRTD